MHGVGPQRLAHLLYPPLAGDLRAVAMALAIEGSAGINQGGAHDTASHAAAILHCPENRIGCRATPAALGHPCSSAAHRFLRPEPGLVRRLSMVLACSMQRSSASRELAGFRDG